jgi:hypothetical protein
VPRSFRKIMQIYEKMSSNLQVASVFMDHYNERGKHYLMNYIRILIQEQVNAIKDASKYSENEKSEIQHPGGGRR